MSKELTSNSELLQVSSVEDVLRLEQEAPFIKRIEYFEQQAGVPFELMPYSEKETLLSSRLHELVQIMRVNPVHREKLNKAGVQSITCLEDFQRVPIATREDLARHYTYSKDGLVVPIHHPQDTSGHKIIASGGSTGEPVLSIYRTRELADIGIRAGAFFRRNIIGQHNPATILNLFDNKNGWASNELVQNILERIPGSITIPAGALSVPRAADFFLQQGVTDIAGLPSDFMNLVDLVSSEFQGTQYPEVCRAIYGGEFLDPVIRDKIKSIFPNVKLVSAYSSTQADHMAVQVEDELRITDDINYLEIVDEEGNPLPNGQTGRIIVTRLLGNGDQLLRLDIQDKGSIELPDPQDPLQARKLYLYGRSGDYLRISSYDIKATELLQTSHEILKTLMPVESIMARQLVADETGLHLKLAVNDGTNVQIPREMQYNLMKQAVHQAIGFFDEQQDITPDLGSTQLTVSFVGMQDIERTNAGKIHPFINKRNSNS